MIYPAQQSTHNNQQKCKLLSVVGDHRLQAKIPYAPGDPLLVAHIEQILAQPQGTQAMGDLF